MKPFVILFCLLIAAATSAQSLKERQAIAGLDFSWAEKSILEHYGSAVKVELDQPSFAGDMDAILYADARGATVVANSISKICNDKLGKEALQKMKITKVLMKNDKLNSPKVTIDKGVMVLTVGFSTSEKYFSESELKEAIENLL